MSLHSVRQWHADLRGRKEAVHGLVLSELCCDVRYRYNYCSNLLGVGLAITKTSCYIMVATVCIAVEHGSFSRIRQVAPICTPFNTSMRAEAMLEYG